MCALCFSYYNPTTQPDDRELASRLDPDQLDAGKRKKNINKTNVASVTASHWLGVLVVVRLAW